MGDVEVLTWDGELALTLQESSIGIDELLRLQRKNPLAMIPSTEVFRPPHACSVFDPDLSLSIYWLVVCFLLLKGLSPHVDLIIFQIFPIGLSTRQINVCT